MECKKCGKNIDDKIKFCNHCGSDLTEAELSLEDNSPLIQDNILHSKKFPKKAIIILAFILVIISGILAVYYFTNYLAFLPSSNSTLYKIPNTIISYSEDKLTGEFSTYTQFCKIDFKDKTMLWDSPENNKLNKDKEATFKCGNNGLITEVKYKDKDTNWKLDYDNNGYLINFNNSSSDTKITWSNNYKKMHFNWSDDAIVEFDKNGNAIKGNYESPHLGFNFEKKYDKYNNTILYIDNKYKIKNYLKNIKYKNGLIVEYIECMEYGSKLYENKCKVKYDGSYPTEFLYDNGEKTTIIYTEVSKNEYKSFLSFSTLQIINNYGSPYRSFYNFLKPID